MRRPTGPRRPRIAELVTCLAPTGGWVANENIARPNPTRPPSAYKLENFFPTATGAELRGGSQVHATLGDTTDYVGSFLEYRNGTVERFFASIEGGIYDITTPADPDVSPAPSVSGTLNSVWYSTQFATTGGVFLVAVNASDPLEVYDGSLWYPIGSSDLAQLDYEDGTAAFSVGETVTGATSGATGVIVAMQGTVDNGFIVLKDIASGPFDAGETITSAGGSAKAQDVEQTIFIGISGVDSEKLSFVWIYKNRLFFIEKDSMNVWYQDVDALGGEMTRFPMGGVFPRGGSLLFGASWSLDTSGDGGLSAQCVFMSTEGEVAVYQGGNPSDANDWGLVGVYRVGKPLGPNAWFRAGGDIVVSTDIGLVPLSQAINRDIAALAPSAVSYPIETAWNEEVSARRASYWTCAVWPEQQMALVVLPTLAGTTPRMFVANVRTGAWCEFTNWDGRCIASFRGRLFFGTKGGKVIEGYVTGLDQGAPYTGVHIPLFDDLGSPASIKVFKMARPTVLSAIDVICDMSIQLDYTVRLPPPPAAAVVESSSVWGGAIWGQAKWGGTRTKRIKQDWQSAGGIGYAFAPALQVTSGSLQPLECEIVRIDVTFETADIVT